MSPSLSSRIAAATAAARADAEPCCVFCRAVHVPLATWSEDGRPSALACAAAGACHLRFVKLNAPVPLPTPLDAREAGRTALHASESPTTDLEGN